jgi:DNA-binding MarR family transcriptional regulator
LTAAFDGGVQQVYDELAVAFRPRFYPVVQVLQQCNSIGVSALAARTGMTQPAISQTLHEMERCGLIAWSQGKDKRVRHVTLSPEGQLLCERLVPIWQAAARAVATLEKEIGADLSKILEQASAALERQPFESRLKEQLQ